MEWYNFFGESPNGKCDAGNGDHLPIAVLGEGGISGFHAALDGALKTHRSDLQVTSRPSWAAWCKIIRSITSGAPKERYGIGVKEHTFGWRQEEKAKGPPGD
jgi:hypothetical protein